MNKYRKQLIIDYLGLEPEYITKQALNSLIKTAYQIENNPTYKGCEYCLEGDDHLYRNRTVVAVINNITIFK